MNAWQALHVASVCLEEERGRGRHTRIGNFKAEKKERRKDSIRGLNTRGRRDTRRGSFECEINYNAFSIGFFCWFMFVERDIRNKEWKLWITRVDDETRVDESEVDESETPSGCGG